MSDKPQPQSLFVQNFDPKLFHALRTAAGIEQTTIKEIVTDAVRKRCHQYLSLTERDLGKK